MIAQVIFDLKWYLLLKWRKELVFAMALRSRKRTPHVALAEECQVSGACMYV